MAMAADSRSRIDALSAALAKMKSTTEEACRCCDQINKRSRQLDSLTSPASDASAMLSQAASNLGATVVIMKDALEKFDTVGDCEPAIERLHRGVSDAEQKNENRKGRTSTASNTVINVSEQDVYAAVDSMEIIRDAFDFFLERKQWRSTPSALGGLERVHKMGVNAMCALVTNHLMTAGPAVRVKRLVKKDGGGTNVPAPNETASQARDRLAAALQNRDLLRSIGEFEEFQPVDARHVRELRAIFECLSGNGFQLGPARKKEPPSLAAMIGISPNKVVRTEKVGSGGYSNLVKEPLKTGFPHIDAYGDARKNVAFTAVDGYYRRIKQERKKNAEKSRSTVEGAGGADDLADVAARDAVRCLEHTMIVVAGERNVYRSVVAPSLKAKPAEEDTKATENSPQYKKACIVAYSHVVGCVVDRTMDVLETVFLKEGGIGQSSGAKGEKIVTTTTLDVRAAASAAAAGLRMLDGVRMLGPSLAKLCEMPLEEGTESSGTVAAALCIAIHRTTVKNTSRTLENLAKAVQDDPLDGPEHRPKDARIASVSSDVVRAIRLVSPFVSAYKSVTKRRALPWDPNIGEEAGELDSFIRFLVMRLLNSLKGKAFNYTRDPGDDAQAKSSLFMINNTFYLLRQLGPSDDGTVSGDVYRIEGSWFVDKVSRLYDAEKTKYLGHWEVLNAHLTAVDKGELEYQKNDNILSLDSGRLIKSRFSGFNDDFERTYNLHKELSVIDPGLRKTIQKEVKSVFVPRYQRFYDKYSKIRFSKKHQDEYTKYSPQKVEAMIDQLFTGGA